MRRATLVVLVLLAVVGSQPAATSEPAGLKIVNKSFDAENGKITFDLLNTSDKLVTAWRLSEVFSPDGRPGPEIRSGKDGHICLHYLINGPGPSLDREGRNRSPAPSIVLGAPASSRLVGEATHAARLQGDVVPLAGWKPALPARAMDIPPRSRRPVLANALAAERPVIPSRVDRRS